ncbi:MAG: hypothetical protein KC777_17990 [Cyanobacteria bacterium HKST-UBA02]|nr:hypothetical protein [Cyanobacteria bacterium HKST-UBA02]
MTKKISRKIQFYKVLQDPADGPFSRQKFLREISQLSFQEAGQLSPYLESDDESDLCLWNHSKSNNIKLVFARVRRNALPELEDRGKIRPLNIPSHQGVLEKSHLIFFKNGIVGAEYNHYGPRINSLSWYSSSKLKNHPKIKFEHFANDEFNELIANIRDPKELKLVIAREQIGMLKPVSKSLVGGLEYLRDCSDAFEIEIVLKSRNKQNRFNKSVTTRFSERISGLLPRLGKHKNSRMSADVLEVKAIDDRTGKTSVFDLLKDKILTEEAVDTVDSRHRIVNSTKMFAAIERSFASLHDTLETLNNRYQTHNR